MEKYIKHYKNKDKFTEQDYKFMWSAIDYLVSLDGDINKFDNFKLSKHFKHKDKLTVAVLKYTYANKNNSFFTDYLLAGDNQKPKNVIFIKEYLLNLCGLNTDDLDKIDSLSIDAIKNYKHVLLANEKEKKSYKYYSFKNSDQALESGFVVVQQLLNKKFKSKNSSFYSLAEYSGDDINLLIPRHVGITELNLINTGAFNNSKVENVLINKPWFTTIENKSLYSSSIKKLSLGLFTNLYLQENSLEPKTMDVNCGFIPILLKDKNSSKKEIIVLKNSFKLFTGFSKIFQLTVITALILNFLNVAFLENILSVFILLTSTFSYLLIALMTNQKLPYLVKLESSNFKSTYIKITLLLITNLFINFIL
jgi:hypothetical protein